MSVYRYRDKWRAQVRKRNMPILDRIFATKAEAQSAEREHFEAAGFRAPADEITVSEAWNRYQASRVFLEKRERTRRTEKARAKPLIAALGRYTLQHLDANPGIVYDYIDTRSTTKSKRTGKKLSATSVRLEIAALSSIVEWAVLRRILRENFVSHVRRPSQAKRKRRVPPSEQGSLSVISSVYNHDQMHLAEPARFMLLLRGLGRRPGELASLLRSDVNLHKREVFFPDTKPGDDQRVHVVEEACDLLRKQLRYAAESAPDSPYVFSTRRRRFGGVDPTPKWAPYNYPDRVKTLRARAVVGTDFHAHAMRREFVSRAIEAGIPYSTIRKQTGHHSTQAIEIYDEGLSTAPEIRAALDKHFETVDDERLLGMLLNKLEAIGAREELFDQVRAALAGDKTVKIGRIYPGSALALKHQKKKSSK